MPGTRVERRPKVTLPAGVKIKCLRDEMLVKALEWKPSEIIEIAGSKRKTIRGTVVAIGPGCYPWIYNAPKGERRTSMRRSTRFKPTEIKVGQTVELGGLEVDGYGFDEWFIDNELHVKCREEDVVGVYG